MNNNPLISIIITTYRRSELLERCIQSALAQKYSPVEILVVEDGPTADTANIVAEYHDRIDYITKEHGGISSTRNVGCRSAKGQYIAFVDDDDLFRPRRLEALFEALRKHPDAVCAFSQGTTIDQDGNDTGVHYFNDEHWPDSPRVIETAYEKMIATQITVTPLNSLFLREAGQVIGWFDEGFKHGCEDTDFFMRLSQVGAFVCVPEALTWIRAGDRDSLTRSELQMALSKLQLLEKHLKIRPQKASLAGVAILRKREYAFLKKLALSRKAKISLLAKQQEVSLLQPFLRLPILRMGYLLYLRFLKPAGKAN
jgi:glycosyltransferase involved in cell wall biosynthesis